MNRWHNWAAWAGEGVKTATDALAKAGKQAGERAGELVRKAGAQAQIAGLQGEISDLYKKIGGAVYAAYKGEQETPDFSALLTQIDKRNAQILEIKARMPAEPDGTEQE